MNSRESRGPAPAERTRLPSRPPTRGSLIRGGRIVLGAVATIACVLVLAQWLLTIFEVKKYLIPKPTDILARFAKSWTDILSNSWVTLQEVLMGFVISAFLGVSVSVLITYVPVLKRFVYPIIVTTQTVPIIAIAPLLIVWFGFGMLPKVLTVVLIATFPIIISCTSGFESMNPNLGKLVASMGGNRVQEFLKVRFLSAIPSLIAGLKVGIALSVVGAVVGEFVGADAGLGYMLVVANADLQTALIFAVLIALTVIGVTLFYAIELVAHGIPAYRHRG